jgi:WD40 repeat protein
MDFVNLLHTLCNSGSTLTGKFDAPDRMFHSIDQCFSCVLTNHADVKELIPEFYNPKNDFDFLINARGLQLGATQNGDRVNDVSLPPWAKSPRDFLRKNSKALESDICTQMLPRWIDLIFGSKSRGEAAKEASNVFHRFSYMGPSDLAALATAEERFQAELQATEFGIVPDQLFIGPHPLKHETGDDSFVKPDIGRTSFSGTEEGKGEGAWELLETPSTNFLDQPEQQPEFVIPVPTNSSSEFESEARDRHHPFNEMFDGGSSPQRGGRNRSDRPGLPLSGTGDMADRSGAGFGGVQPSLSNVSSYTALLSPTEADHANARAAAATEWDIKFIEKSRIHADAISGCAFIAGTAPILVTTSLDGGLKVHNVSIGLTESEEASKSQGITSTLSRFSYITMTRGQGNPANQTKLTEFRSHTSRDALACLALASDGHGGKIAFSGGHDDVVFAYGITSGCAVASVYSHRDAVTGLDLMIRPPLVVESKLWPEQSTHIMVSGSWDATVKVWSVTVANGETVSIDREPLAELFDADSPIVCVSAANVPNDGGVVIGAGCADGSFCVWNLHSDGVKVVIHKEQAKRGSGPCSVVKWSMMGGRLHLFTGFATGKVASFTLSSGAMRKVSAASVGVAVQCLAYSENILLVGCADGGLRLIPTRDGAQFTTDLSLWPAVNNKSSPGLSSVGMSFVGNAADGSGKCVCCTGAEDGSVALFELKPAHR